MRAAGAEARTGAAGAAAAGAAGRAFGRLWIVRRITFVRTSTGGSVSGVGAGAVAACSVPPAASAATASRPRAKMVAVAAMAERETCMAITVVTGRPSLRQPSIKAWENPRRRGYIRFS